MLLFDEMRWSRLFDATDKMDQGVERKRDQSEKRELR